MPQPNRITCARSVPDVVAVEPIVERINRHVGVLRSGRLVTHEMSVDVVHICGACGTGIPAWTWRYVVTDQRTGSTYSACERHVEARRVAA